MLYRPETFEPLTEDPWHERRVREAIRRIVEDADAACLRPGRALALAGAELVWQAGPPGMEKGPCICHGTAGNGYAFLTTFERTGDEEWLERARRFAVHALEQVERRGRGRYSLWTGDVGVALYAAGCLEARGEYPVLDTL